MKNFFIQRFVKSWKTALIGAVILVLILTGTLDNALNALNSLISGLSTVIQGVGTALAAWLLFRKEKRAVEEDIRKEIADETPEELARGFDRATDHGKR